MLGENTIGARFESFLSAFTAALPAQARRADHERALRLRGGGRGSEHRFGGGEIDDHVHFGQDLAHVAHDGA